MNRAASTISLLLLWVLATGCSSQRTEARIRVRAFEIPTDILRQHTSEGRLYKLSESAYSLSVVTRNELNAMLSREDARPYLLADSTRFIDDWPGETDTWLYSPALGGGGQDALRTGGGVGFLGARDRAGRLEVHIDYLIDHRGPQGQKLIESKIFYEYYYPEGKVLLFHTPSSASDRRPRHHVVAVEAAREDRTSAYGALYPAK